ncbi:Alpha/Beta hydrolase protein [Mycena rosella]|uniref:Dipeptidyl-peptidase V n=1 Tax=Mycena rosella TaxID=1033263 RepID=A0AAD7GHU0_MYCRO|nr:Alpha/Beta hydrolase protein [Mycena rosella]
MRFPFSLLSLSAAQTILQPRGTQTSLRAASNLQYALKEASDVFSPKDLVELERPGTGVANDEGDLVLVPYSKYSFDEKKNNKYISIAPLEAATEPIEIALANGGEAFWLDRRTIGHAVKGDSNLDLYALNINFGGNFTGVSSDPPTLIGSFPTTTASKFQYSSSGSLVFVDLVYADGNLSATKEQDEAWNNRGTTALVYDDANVRFWDTWGGPKTASLFRVELAYSSDRAWKMGTTFDNLLKGTGHSSDDFHLVGGDVLYTSGDPELPQSLHGRRNVYLVSVADPGNPVQLTTGKQGRTGSPKLNSNASKAAWIQMDEDIGGPSTERIILFDLITKVRFTLGHKWDRSPESLVFSLDGDVLYLTAEEHARIKIFALPIPPTPVASTARPSLHPRFHVPVALTHTGAASGLQPLPNSCLLFSSSSFTSPNDVYLIRGLSNFESNLKSSRPSSKFKGKIDQITRLTADTLKGKDLDQGEEFWFKGALNKDVQGWLFKPKGWTKHDKKKWPVAMIIHGGPQSAWADQWSTRWNPNVFSQQGYFAIFINPTGSTGFGAEFTEAITEDWGGKPFVDMLAGYGHVLESYPQIDPDRAVAAGASWGGYAINWIQGHPEYNFNFKALVCHDGVFDSSYSSYTSDVPFLFNLGFGGVPWGKKGKALSKKFSPSNFVDRWSTPQLTIHGSKDYRLPETESLAPFHALQQLGVPSRLIIFPDENHWVLGHENSLKWHYEVFKWFDEFVGDRVNVI